MDAVLKATVCRAVAVATTLTGPGCGDDDCTALPSAFELEVVLDVNGDRPALGSLRVIMEADGERWWRFYDVTTVFEDDRTSFAVELVPARAQTTPLTLDLALFTGSDGSGTLLARQRQTFQLLGNACNAFLMELEIPDG